MYNIAENISIFGDTCTKVYCEQSYGIKDLLNRAVVLGTVTDRNFDFGLALGQAPPGQAAGGAGGSCGFSGPVVGGHAGPVVPFLTGYCRLESSGLDTPARCDKIMGITELV